jgi:PBP1b-binding outer membrane lipoprotein LpoB
MKNTLIILIIFIFGCNSNTDQPAKINTVVKAEKETILPTAAVEATTTAVKKNR